MKSNSSGLNTRVFNQHQQMQSQEAMAVAQNPEGNANGHNSQSNLKSYIEGLKKVTNQKTKSQRNPNKQGGSQGQYSRVLAQNASNTQQIPHQAQNSYNGPLGNAGQQRPMSKPHALQDAQDANDQAVIGQLMQNNGQFVRTQSRQGSRQSNNSQPANTNLQLLSPSNAQMQQMQKYVPTAANYAAYSGASGHMVPPGNIMSPQSNLAGQRASTQGQLGSKAYQYLQKKGNVQMQNPAQPVNQPSHVSSNNQMPSGSAQAQQQSDSIAKRISSGRRTGMDAINLSKRSSNTRGGLRNSSQGQANSAQMLNMGQNYNQAAPGAGNAMGQGQVPSGGMMTQSQNFNKKQLSGLMSSTQGQLPMGNPGVPATTKHQNMSETKPDLRNVKDVIIRKQSSKSLLSPQAAAQQDNVQILPQEQNVRHQHQNQNGPAQPFRQKSQPARGNNINGQMALAGELKTDSTAADETRKKLTHSLGNQGSLNMSSGPAGIFYGAGTHTIKDTLGNKTQQMNLSNMLKSQNLLEEDGIEDLHFYFVSFHQHKRMILNHHRNKSAGQTSGARRGQRQLDSASPSVQKNTIESCDEELF